MDVALLTPAYWPELARGTQRLTHDLGHGLLARGARPRVITSHRGGQAEGVEEGLAVTRVWRPPRGALERRHYERDITHLPLAYRALSRSGADIAHALWPADALAAARWSERAGRPSLFTYRGLPDHRTLTARRLRAKLIADAASGCRATCVPSEASAAAMRRWLGVEPRVIAPGVDLEGFRPAERRAEAPTIFCAVDASDPSTRVALLLEAFERVRREHPTARLRLAEPSLPHQAAALRGAAPGLDLVPPVAAAPELAREYGAAWVTVLPSVGVSFPGSLLESLACGTPAVGPSLDGVRELVNDESTGRLFEEDAHDLARAVLEAMELARDQSAARACRARAETLPVGATVDAYLALYEELLAD